MSKADSSRWVWVALGTAVALTWAHQLWLFDWMIDDAAISAAYARNLVDGEGLVPTPGGERVEGYSNPLWVFMLALFEVFGVSGMWTARVAPLGLSAVSAWASWRIADRLLDGRPEALAAPFLLAVSAQSAIWNASGLENPMFTCLVLLGLLAAQQGALTAAGLAYAGVGLTRPEGAAYGGIVGLWMLALHRGSAWRFWVAFSGPVAVHQVWRLWYFAWPLPNTYYAKLGHTIDRVSFGSRGWVQLRTWGDSMGMGWMLPLFAAGTWGRPLAGVVALGVTVGAFQLPDLWRIGVLLGLVVAGPMFAPVAPLLRICAHLAAFALAFGVYADGDWMIGYRWMSLPLGPLAVLFAVGLATWTDAVARWLGPDRDPVVTRERVAWIGGVGLLGGLASVNVPATEAFSRNPEDYPEMIARRLRYTDSVAARLGIDRHRVSTLEMDMGAHMMWSPYTLVDLAGLVDVPISRHTFDDHPFFQQYVFDEKKPDFAHLHGGWAKYSQLLTYPAWHRNYVRLPPYDDAGTPHEGVWLRRAHVLREAREPIARGGGVAIDELTLVHDHVGDRVRLRIGFHPETSRRLQTIELVVGKHAETIDLGWIEREQWKGDTFVWTAPLPASPSPRIGVEVHVGDEVPLATTLTAGREGPTDHAGVSALAAEGRCADAESGWELVADLYPRRREGREAARTAIADCLALQAEAVAEPTAKLQLLERAHTWDHRARELVRVAAPLAAERYADGLRAREAGEAELAYRAFSDVLKLTPENSWARRYAEEARLR